MISSPEVWKEFFETYYREKVNKLAESIENGKKPTLYVDVKKDLLYFREMKLMEELFRNPDKVIRDAQEGLALVHTIHDVDLSGCKVRFKNVPPTRRLLVKQIDCDVINRFIAVEGIVRRVTEIRPYVVKAVYRCQNCGDEIELSTGGGRLPRSMKCQCRGRMELQMDKCTLTNVQRVEIQDLPENLDSGEPPRLLRVVLMDELAGKLLPGDKVIINGIARATIDRNSSAILDVYLEANSLEYIQQDVRSLQITESDKKKIRELAKRPDIYDLLVKSIAPSIKGYETVKLAIVLQLFGGVSRVNPDGTKVRGDIHILLVGDPSVAKSQILRAVKQIAPRAVLTTGYSSSGAGLTVTAVKGEDGKWTIEAGALVLADRGIALIDELEKMNKNDRRYILEALEQQTISIAKAGINATLNSRCSVLAAANPKRGRFNKFEPLVEQIDIEPPLLSRFDLVFVIMDEPDERKDEELADFILSDSVEEKQPAIPVDLLRKYILYVRREIKDVKIDEEAKRKLKEFYKMLRSMSKEDNAIAITARQLEALRRLTEASAKARLSRVATVEDAERAISIFRKCLEQIAIDPETGKIDIDYAFTGTSATQRDRIAIIKKIVEELEAENERGAPEEEIFRLAEQRGISREKAEEILAKLKQNGEIFSPRNGFYRVVKRS